MQIKSMCNAHRPKKYRGDQTYKLFFANIASIKIIVFHHGFIFKNVRFNLRKWRGKYGLGLFTFYDFIKRR